MTKASMPIWSTVAISAVPLVTSAATAIAFERECVTNPVYAA